MTNMQSRMEVSEKSNAELRAEIALLRNVGSVSGSSEASNVNTRQEVQNTSVSGFESTNTSASPSTETADQAPPAVAVARASTQAAKTSHVGTLTPTRAYAAVVTTGKPGASEPKRQSKTGEKLTRSSLSALQTTLPKIGQVDEEGFTRVEKKKKRKPCTRNQSGTAPSGPNMLLRPAVPTTQLYISRLHHFTKVVDIVEYLKVKTNWTLRVARLEARHDVNFKSFVVRVPTQHLQTFLKEDFWPKGVVYRRFRGRLHDTTQRNTTPTTLRA
ncbi:hypothetical protein PYW08_003928 [Mythimna loreyi]|uniref:Uncharacterized protein n=1 Tax=Mythimna loreyi TaxID=667449 RepID=A0ACC2QU09_9NEOP|nr:hypothetical protein PYW08_003928 [Mythimna loreyi]